MANQDEIVVTEADITDTDRAMAFLNEISPLQQARNRMLDERYNFEMDKLLSEVISLSMAAVKLSEEGKLILKKSKVQDGKFYMPIKNDKGEITHYQVFSVNGTGLGGKLGDEPNIVSGPGGGWLKSQLEDMKIAFEQLLAKATK